MTNEAQSWVVEVEKSLLGQNATYAHRNREAFQRAGLLVLNLVSSPGSGKTTLLERTLNELGGKFRLGIQVGDPRTDNDARRLRGRGAPVAQIVTGGVCHLEAAMVAKALAHFSLDQLDILIIENVGNLVCTASFDLGEDLRVVLLSVTEGEDKPLKYPGIFRDADLVVITKMDMILAAGIDLDLLRDNIRRVAVDATILELSARSGAGMADWYAALAQAKSSPNSLRRSRAFRLANPL